METRRRRVHFGIDYGTSNSKLVVRDFGAAGGERAHVVVQNASARLSSSLALAGNEIIFGLRRTDSHRFLQRATWYESLKMRAAGEITGNVAAYYHGPPGPLPTGLSAQEMAALTIWWLVTEASRAAETLVPRRQGEVVAPGMTLGIPMSFYRDVKLRAAFVELARVGWQLFRHGPRLEDGRLNMNHAKSWVAEAYRTIRSDPIAANEVRLWIRTEAEAALWWAFQSPQVPEGPYAKVDIGAGTTNASVFRIVEGHPAGVATGPRVRLKMAFFGADSQPVGMDSVDGVLAGSDPSRLTELRGREDSLLKDPEAQQACRPALDGMHKALREAWRQNGLLNYGAQSERQAWIRDCKVFLIGGGSLVQHVRELVSAMPPTFNPQRRLPVVNLERPPDLRGDGRLVQREVLPFVLVAYGLSVLAPPIPMIETPDEVPPMAPSGPTVRQLNHEDIYVD